MSSNCHVLKIIRPLPICVSFFLFTSLPVSLFLYPSNSRPISLPLFVSISSSCLCLSLALVVFIFPLIPSLYRVSSYVVCLSVWSACCLSVLSAHCLSCLRFVCMLFVCLFSTVLPSLGLLIFRLSDLSTSVCQISLYLPSIICLPVHYQVCLLSFRSLSGKRCFGSFAFCAFVSVLGLV